MRVELFPGKHLFVDEHRIETLTAAKRVLNQPQKRPQPVMQAERPWEQKGIHLGKVLYDRDRQRFRLWYTAQADTVIGTRVLVRDNPPKNVHESHICYAESADGIHWERPALDIVERERYPGNNICLPSMRPPGRTFLSHLVDDPFADDPQQRFKMIYLDQADESAVGGGLAPDQRLRLHAHSADGLYWHSYPREEHHVARLFGVLAYLDEVPLWPD